MSSLETIILGASVLAVLVLLIVLFFGRFKMNKLQKSLEQTVRERNQMKKKLSSTEHIEAVGLLKANAAFNAKKNQTLQKLEEAKAEVEKQFHAVNLQKSQMLAEIDLARQAAQEEHDTLKQQVSNLNAEIGIRQKEIIQLNDEILLQSFGFYKTKYDLESTALYKVRLDQNRKEQEKMIKADKAVYSSSTGVMLMDGSKAEGKKLLKDYVKLILRSFNNECDASIITVKFSNLDSVEKKIRKAYDTLNELGARMSIVISSEYLSLKIDELYLCYEFSVKKQEEKEAQQMVRAQMREEAKILKEIEEQKAKLEKEQKHFTKAMKTLDSQLKSATTEAERQILVEEKHKIEEKLVEVTNDMVAVEKREQSTRAGYVYIISNIGSFGEGVYKIGVTRRLDPQERVDELGDASVPFEFDVHALIFSEDAPKLETALHKAFETRRVNMINRRREFFQVDLDEIEHVVKTNFSKPVEFIRLADASEYRQSLILREEREQPLLFAATA